jgi:hypothetical protein
MASLKIYTRQDKAAFLNHLGKYDILINTENIEDIKKDGNNKSYFILNNIDNITADKIKDLFNGHADMDITVLKEILRRMIREELSK